MTEMPDLIESIFAATVVLANTEERAAYIDQVCSGDAALRTHLEALLRAHDRAGHLLDRPVPGGPERTEAYIPNAQPGAVIAGRYKLLEAIGEGGMGAVWVAEQTQPVRRKVALKLIKPGMDSKSVLARFEAERQALAVMDHPNIAKVLDGGLSETGRPYFVMEYVKGVPITEYCDTTRLNVPERLNLFVQVCQAVQHAHQKGIIHRDLKPTNILVAPYDDKPVPKVIDFGLAKAMHQALTERTLHTAHETVLGTPLYMSPEQAQLNNLDVDTRSDIYSLGVLLYELLTGTTPLELQRCKEAAWEEIKRLVREDEPPRPSTRLSSSDTLASLAAGRHTEPARLTKLVRGELDWIVMKALEKDRTRRYETANALADDITRYLHDEPVLAGPPRAGYRLRKFLRRNRKPVLAVVIVLFSLVGGIVGTTWGLVRAGQALDAEAEQRHAAERLAHEKAELAKVERQSRDRADRQSELALKTLNLVVFDIASKLDGVPGAHEVRRSLLSTAIDGLKQVARTLDVAPIADHSLVWSHIQLGDVFLLAGGSKSSGTEEARKQFQIAHELAKNLAHDHPQNAQLEHDLAISCGRLGKVNLQSGHTTAARDNFQEGLEVSQKLAHDDPKDVQAQNDLSTSYFGRGNANMQLGRTAAARDDFQRELEMSQKLAHDYPQNAEVQSDLSAAYLGLGEANQQLGNMPAARDGYLKCLEIFQKLATDDPQKVKAQTGLFLAHLKLGEVNLELGDTAAASEAFQRDLEISQKRARDDPENHLVQSELAISYANLGSADQQLGNALAARDDCQKALEISQKLARDDPQDAAVQSNLVVSLARLGNVNLQLGDVAAARNDFQTHLEISQKLARDDPQNATVQFDLSISYRQLGDMNLQLGNLTAAHDHYRKLLEISERLANDDPQDARLQSQLAGSFERLGSVNLQLGKALAARDGYQKAFEISQKLARDDPRNATARRDLATSLEKLADAKLELGNAMAARNDYQTSLEIIEKLTHDDPRNARFRRELAASRESLGTVDLQLGNLTAARDGYQKSLEVRQKMAHDDSKNAEAQMDLASSFGDLGNLEMANEDFQPRRAGSARESRPSRS